MDSPPPDPPRLNWKSLYCRGCHVDHRLPQVADGLAELTGHVGDNFFHELIDWTPRGILAATGGHVDHFTYTQTGDLVLAQKMGVDASSRSPKFCPAMSHQFAVSSWSDHANNAIGNVLFDVETGQRITHLGQLRPNIVPTNLAFHPTQPLVCFTVAGHQLEFVDLREPRKAVAEATIEHDGLVYRWNRDGTCLATSDMDGSVMLMDYAELGVIRCKFKKHSDAARALTWNPWDQTQLISGGAIGDCFVLVWDSDTGTDTASVSLKPHQISGIVYQWTNRELCITTGYDKWGIHLFKVKKTKITKVFQTDGHTRRILDVVTSPDSNSVATIGADSVVKVWSFWQ